MTEPFFRIWGRPDSHNVKKVVWFAAELGLAFTRIDMGGSFGFSEEYLAHNPNGLIPTIADGKLTLWESNTIVRYMAAEYGGPRWYLADPIDRALAERWLDWQTGYGAAQKDMYLGLVRTPEDQREAAAIAASKAACARLLAVLDTQLATTPWLSGHQIGVGDIAMGPFIHSWFTLAPETAKLPHVHAWYQRLLERPAYLEHVALPLS
ncbi:glutathione S-transferase family protein [Novosphingobium sp. BW1]|uniref:glutathione S-transferase family protein n=1 Tax=Novosphingobium sp. BW1 TaxID=2592621 RepID=UPI0011DEEC93|nr:glutathione S-transferase family protein [Novosphingobium sp. BW1]TYC86905.1 glutathione S-transferase family protein [Novosphingobium sp. BW1]